MKKKLKIVKKNITITFVTFHSDHLIFKRLNNYKSFKTVVVENSLKKQLKKKIEQKYKLTKVLIPKKNLGYGGGNNLSFSVVRTKYCLIMNPDAYLTKKNLDNLLSYVNKLPEFGILFPRFNGDVSLNYFKNCKNNFKSVYYDNFLNFSSGCCMLLNLKLLKKKVGFFDQNFFLYNEEQDLVKRCQDKKVNIYLLKNCIINHRPNSSHDPKKNPEIEILKHWHYTWSEFYFLKKHFGYFFALKKMSGELIKSFCMSIWTFVTLREHKSKRYRNRFKGLFTALVGMTSHLRTLKK